MAVMILSRLRLERWAAIVSVDAMVTYIYHGAVLCFRALVSSAFSATEVVVVAFMDVGHHH